MHSLTRKRVQPSMHYPDYFKMDLGIGGQDPHPLARALDEALSDIFVLGQKIAHSLDPAYFNPEQEKTALQHFGFQVKTLVSAEWEKFFSVHQEIFREKGTVRAVELLAGVYFASSSAQVWVGRGRPFKRERIRVVRGGLMRLCDSEDRKSTVCVRLGEQCQPERIEEFRSNCLLIVPDGYSVIVLPPSEPITKVDPRLNLEKPLRIVKRRL